MNNKPLKEYQFDKLLLNKETVKRVMTDYSKWNDSEDTLDKYRELTITMGINILIIAVSVLPSFLHLSTFSKVAVIIALLLLTAYTLFCATRWSVAYKELKTLPEKDLYNEIIEKAQENIKYTAIGRVVYKNNNQVMYLTGNDYFLPHWEMNKDLSINAQTLNVAQSLNSDFDIKEKDIIRIRPIDEDVHFSIKPVHGSIKMNAYVFYDIILKEQVKGKFTSGSNSKRKWMTIENMEKIPTALSSNEDVIGYLKELPKIKESFENILGDYKVIWNITSKCSYNCAICATHDENRQEISMTDKSKVLHNIFTAKDMIKSLDFAGGDPLQDDESVTLIQNAIDVLGSDRVSITTTGKGIEEISTNDSLKMIKHCEITLDAAHNYLNNDSEKSGKEDLSRDENDYSQSNEHNINLISNRIDSLTINIPIINDDLTDEEIDTLVNRVASIKKRLRDIELDTSLIRLMPSGRLALEENKEMYKDYNPIEVVNKIKSKIESNNIICRLHCSLRILPCFNKENTFEHCNMLENKIGIDCAGNVFACAWGGYVQNDSAPTQNPYYLGNLIKNPLTKILSGECRSQQYTDIYNEINNKNFKHHCSVVSYYLNKSVHSNFDPLANISNSNEVENE